MSNTHRTYAVGALGECIHLAGVTNFLRLTEAAGWRTEFLGPAVFVQQRFLGGSDLWLLTRQRLLMIGKKGLIEKTLFDPGENTVYHEIGELQFK